MRLPVTLNTAIPGFGPDRLIRARGTELARLCRRIGAQVLQAVPDLETALRSALEQPRGGVVCVTGSLMLVGQARTALGLPPPEQLW